MKALVVKNPVTGMTALHFKAEDVRDLGLVNEKRVLACVGDIEWHCSLWSDESTFYLHVHAQLLKKLKAFEGEELELTLKKDNSEYQAPFPEEWQEILWSDPDAKVYFDALTPGGKRTILFYLNRFKSSEKRIEWGLSIAEKLKEGETDLMRLMRK